MGEWDSSGLFPPEVACDSSPGMWKLLGLALGFELWMDPPSPSRPTRSLTGFSALFSSWVVLMFCCQARGREEVIFFCSCLFALRRGDQEGINCTFLPGKFSCGEWLHSQAYFYSRGKLFLGLAGNDQNWSSSRLPGVASVIFYCPAVTELGCSSWNLRFPSLDLENTCDVCLNESDTSL